MIRVFIADDHAVVRVGLRHVLTEIGGFDVVGEAADGRRVLNAPELASADVLVLDLSLPIVSGTEVLRRLRHDAPELGIVVHSMHPASQFARFAFEAGASAYVPKDAPPSELIAAVRASARRRLAAPKPPEADAESAPHASLSPRELQVFLLLVEGRQVADIAAELDLHSSTVSNHLARVRDKLAVQSVAELVQYAWAWRLVEPPPSFGKS